MFKNLLQRDPSVYLTGYQNSFAPGNLVVQIGLLGHLPSCCGGCSCGGGGAAGASIVRAKPSGFSFQDLGEITLTGAEVVTLPGDNCLAFTAVT